MHLQPESQSSSQSWMWVDGSWAEKIGLHSYQIITKVVMSREKPNIGFQDPRLHLLCKAYFSASKDRIIQCPWSTEDHIYLHLTNAGVQPSLTTCKLTWFLNTRILRRYFLRSIERFKVYKMTIANIGSINPNNIILGYVRATVLRWSITVGNGWNGLEWKGLEVQMYSYRVFQNPCNTTLKCVKRIAQTIPYMERR